MIGRFVCPEPLCAQVESLRASVQIDGLSASERMRAASRLDDDRLRNVLREVRAAMPKGVWMRVSEVIAADGVSFRSTLVREAMALMHARGELVRHGRSRNVAWLWMRVA